MAKYPTGVPALRLRAQQGDVEAYAMLLEEYRGKLNAYCSLQITDINVLEDHVTATLAEAATAQRTWQCSQTPLDEWLILQLNTRLRAAGHKLELAGVKQRRGDIDLVAPDLPLQSAAIILMLNIPLTPASIAEILSIDIQKIRAASRAYAQARAQAGQT